jgi:hypothetical protein
MFYNYPGENKVTYGLSGSVLQIYNLSLSIPPIITFFELPLILFVTIEVIIDDTSLFTSVYIVLYRCYILSILLF